MQQALQNMVFISTRPAQKSEQLKALFEAAGAQLIEFPTIKVSPTTLKPVDEEILKKLDQLDWLIFTSANGVKFFFQKVHELGLKPPKISIAVIGNKTAKLLLEYGIKPDFTGPTTDIVAFVKALKNEIGAHKPAAIWVTGKLSPATNEELLSEAVRLVRVNVYQTGPSLQVDTTVLKRIAEDRYNLLFFYSPSAVYNFMEMAKAQVQPAKLKVGCIGPTTKKACISMGIEPFLTAEESSDKGIFEAAVTHFSELKNTK